MNSPGWSCQQQSRTGQRTASNGSLIDWDKNVLNYVYSCMHPDHPSAAFQLLPSSSAANQADSSRSNTSAFRRTHRRIVSASFPHPPGPARPSRLTVLPRPRGHYRNASDPGSNLFYAPPSSYYYPPLPTTAVVVNEKSGLTTPPYSQDVAPPPPLPPPPPPPPPLDIDRVDSGTNRTSRSTTTSLSGDELAASSSDEETTCLFPSLQALATGRVLLICLCLMSFLQSLVSSGYLSSIVSTLERRFDLTSRQVGYMYCCYQTTSVLATVAFSFIHPARQNRPRIIGLLGIVLGLGFALFALPHWLSGPYNPGKLVSQQKTPSLCGIKVETAGNGSLPPPFIDRSHCNQTGVTLLRIGQEAVIESDYTVALPVFCCAMALAGFGSSSLTVLAPTFFWDNLPPAKYPLYSGLLYSSAGLGPAFGFMAGAAVLQVYIDSPSIPASSSSGGQMDVYSPSWLGAWWLGMLVFGVVTCLPALPVMAFPRRLPSSVAAAAAEGEDGGGPEETLVGNQETGDSACDQRQRLQQEKVEAPLPTLEADDGPPPAYLGRFPEPIPEASESMTLHSLSTPTPPPPPISDSPECKLHRRSSSYCTAKSPTDSAATAADDVVVKGKKVKRQDKGLASMCARLRVSLARKYRGRAWVFLRVMTNPIWLGVTAITVAETTIVSAYLTYAVKYLQAQFRVPAHLASIHMGAVVVPSAVSGVLTGALLMQRFRPSISRTLLAALLPLCATLATVLVLMLGFNCTANQMAGVTATYDGKPNWRFDGSLLQHPSNLTVPCNEVCRVHSDGRWNSASLYSCPLASDYDPVCWESAEDPSLQMSFLNPCLAGCSGQSIQKSSGSNSRSDGKPVEVYTDCNCVTNSSLIPRGVHSQTTPGVGGTVKRGACTPQCPHYVPFLLVTFLTIFLTCVSQNPSNVVTLSCVDRDDATAAYGLQAFFTRTIAFIPTPVYFGALMDLTCRVRALPQQLVCEWDLDGGSGSGGGPLLHLSGAKLAPPEGACLEYDVHRLPYAFFGLIAGLKLLSFTVGLATWRYSCRLESRKPRKSSSAGPVTEEEADQESGDHPRS